MPPSHFGEALRCPQSLKPLHPQVPELRSQRPPRAPTMAPRASCCLGFRAGRRSHQLRDHDRQCLTRRRGICRRSKRDHCHFHRPVHVARDGNTTLRAVGFGVEGCVARAVGAATIAEEFDKVAALTRDMFSPRGAVPPPLLIDVTQIGKPSRSLLHHCDVPPRYVNAHRIRAETVARTGPLAFVKLDRRGCRKENAGIRLTN